MSNGILSDLAVRCNRILQFPTDQYKDRLSDRYLQTYFAIMRRINSGLIVFAAFLVFFLIVHDADQQIDSYHFVLDARNGEAFFHPHHLLFNSQVHILYHVSTALKIDPLRFISIVDSILGAITLAFFFLTAMKRTKVALALAATLALGFSVGYWEFSTSVEVNITSLMFLSLSLYYLSAKPLSAMNSAAVFMFLTLGTLFHQLAALAIIPVFIYEASRHRSYFRALKYALPSLIPGVILYLGIGLTQIQDKNPVGLYDWATMYGHLGFWGTVGWSNFIISLWGLIKAIYGGEFLRQVFYGSGHASSRIIYSAILSLSIAGFAPAVCYAVYRFAKKRDSFDRLLLGIGVIYAAFSFWWNPTDPGFWLYTMMTFLLIIVAAIEPVVWLRGAFYAGVALTIVINMIYEIAPEASVKRSVAIQGAAVLHRLKVTPDDLLLNNLTWASSAFEYYYGIKVPTEAFGIQTDGDEDQVIRKYHAIIDNTPGRVFVFADELEPEPHRKFLHSRFSVEDYRKAYAPYKDRLVPVGSIAAYGNEVIIFQIAKRDSLSTDSSATGISP